MKKAAAIQLNENLLTPEHIERLKAQDPRFNDLDLSLKIQQELRESVALKALLESADEQAAEAMEALVEVDPTDTNMIIRRQAAVFRARFIKRTLNTLIRKGEVAEHSLINEQAIELNDERNDL